MAAHEWLSYRDLSQYTGIAEQTYRNWHSLGKSMPRAHKINGLVRFRRADVDRWLEASAEPSGSAA